MPDATEYGDRNHNHKHKTTHEARSVSPAKQKHKHEARSVNAIYQNHHHHAATKLQAVTRQLSAKKIIMDKKSKTSLLEAGVEGMIHAGGGKNRSRPTSANRTGNRSRPTSANRTGNRSRPSSANRTVRHKAATTVQKIHRGNSERNMQKVKAAAKTTGVFQAQASKNNKRRKSNLSVSANPNPNPNPNPTSNENESSLDMLSSTYTSGQQRPMFHHEQNHSKIGKEGKKHFAALDAEIVQLEREAEEDEKKRLGERYIPPDSDDDDDLESGKSKHSHHHKGDKKRKNSHHHHKHRKTEEAPKSRTEAKDDCRVLSTVALVVVAFYIIIFNFVAKASMFTALLFGAIIPIGLILMTFAWRQAKKEGKQRIFLW